MNIWFKINSKLEDIVGSLKAELLLEDPYMAKECVWQWIECVQKAEKRKFDISRKCNFETEEFSEPVRVTVYNDDGFICDEEVRIIAEKISNILNVAVFTGNIKSDEKEKVQYIINEEISCF